MRVSLLEKGSKLKGAAVLAGSRLLRHLRAGTWLQKAVEIEFSVRLACRQRTFAGRPLGLSRTRRNVAEVGEVEVVRRGVQCKSKETVASAWSLHHRGWQGRCLGWRCGWREDPSTVDTVCRSGRAVQENKTMSFIAVLGSA